MANRYPPLFKNYPHFLHGGDYNPDQWLDRPDIISEDFRLMKLAGCNAFSVGIFSWVMYEPKEGEFTFDWLDKIMDQMAKEGNRVFLATPSGSKPAWISYKYPEACRVLENGLREHHNTRHNHCFTSPIYREKVAIINEQLAKRYAGHEALGGWHISNEYGGRCFCPLCVDAFRNWLKKKYENLAALNKAWWTSFWSHKFTEWEQIDPRDYSIDGMELDWNRFVTYQTVDFMVEEAKVLKKWTPDIPVTTNMMGFYDGLDYWRIAEVCDVIADDSYPQLNKANDNADTASYVGMVHDMHRTMKQGKPFILMESCPSATNWQNVHKVKRPGMHRLEMLQAVGHGADATMYFQWRKGSGGNEKFHGAVVDHEGTENTRVFKDVAEVGAILKKIAPILGTSVAPEVAVIFDWEVRWALDWSGGPSTSKKKYVEAVHAYYKPFWEKGIPVDVIESQCDFTKYKMLVAPMLFMLKDGVADHLKDFVENGGTLILTYMSGIVDSSNRCFTGGWPGQGLRELTGVWAEEIDSLYDEDKQSIEFTKDNLLGLGGSYSVKDYCMLVHAEDSEVIATFGTDFYKGRPAITKRSAGKGTVYYVAARTEDDFLSDFIDVLSKKHNVNSPFPGILVPGTTVQMRTDGEKKYFIVLNPTSQEKVITLTGQLKDVLTGQPVENKLVLPVNGSAVLVM